MGDIFRIVYIPRFTTKTIAMNRRYFLQQSALLTAASVLPFSAVRANTAARQFTMSLDPGAIGVEVDQLRLIELAAQYGFEAVSPYPSFLAEQEKSVCV